MNFKIEDTLIIEEVNDTQLHEIKRIHGTT